MTSKETANRGKPNGQSCGKDCIDYNQSQTTIEIKPKWFKRVE